mmetsp:Transcript_8801/g.17446  ORF Transcript_8801/g.17446 Transcript_8801/m.17446 type:complete len:703 (+) Transcript_8801:247-2355(+)
MSSEPEAAQQGPPMIPININLSKASSNKKKQQQQPIPLSPFFRPSNPRLTTLNTPRGSQRPVIVVKKQVGGEQKDIPLEDEKEKKSSLLGAYANLCNVTIGAGIVGLPYAIKESGLVAGVIMIIACAIMTDYSLRLLINIGKLTNVNSYETLMEATFGRPGFIFLSLNMFAMSYGAMIAYLIIIKDVLPILFHVTPHDDESKRVIMFVSSLFVILPLSMQRDMADLEKTSRLNVFLNMCLVALIVGYAPVTESVQSQGGVLKILSQESLFDFRTFFVGFGVCSFAFVCQDSSFIIAGSISNPTKTRWKKVTRATMTTCCVMELILGICGYLAYQKTTMGNVLNNMNVHHWSGLVSRAILATTMFFAYPLNAFIARHVCVVLLFEGRSAHEGDDSLVLRRRDRRVILTWALYIISLLPALAVENTGKVLAATGAVGGSSLAYIGPGAAFVAVHSLDFINLVQKRWKFCSLWLWCFPTDSLELGTRQLSPGIDIGLSDGTAGCGRHRDPVELSLERDRMNDRKPIALVFHVLAWYIFGMPIWCTIAKNGQKCLAKYAENEETLSPGLVRPKRIVVVPPSRQKYSPGNDEKTDGIFRSPSDSVITSATEKLPLLQPISDLGELSMSDNYGTKQIVAGNKGIAKAIASRNYQSSGATIERTDSLSSTDFAMELEKDDPTWADFRIAIGYIVLGVISMTFGLASIML